MTTSCLTNLIALQSSRVDSSQVDENGMTCSRLPSSMACLVIEFIFSIHWMGRATYFKQEFIWRSMSDSGNEGLTRLGSHGSYVVRISGRDGHRLQKETVCFISDTNSRNRVCGRVTS
jgi:hypothetical protein